MANDFRSLPLVPCPDCGASEAVEILGPASTFECDVPGPGDYTRYHCTFCASTFIAIMPEPAEPWCGGVAKGRT